MADASYWVTRLPGAPPRRAGRVWPLEMAVKADLTAAQLALIAADPGYRLAPVAAPIPSDVPVPVTAKAVRRRG